MTLRQKARGSQIKILGRVYGPRVVGLHNRFRAKTDRYVRYLDLARDENLSRVPYQGLFVPGRDRHRIYLRPGVDELTVAHELMHGILYTEGFVGLRVAKEDMLRYPALGALAGRVGDLLIHPVLVERLRRSRFPVDREEILRGARQILHFGQAGASPRGLSDEPIRDEPSRCLFLFSRAVWLAEALLRHEAFRGPLETIVAAEEPEALDLARRIGERAPWDDARGGLGYRVRAGRMLGFLDEEGTRRGIDLALRDRILLSPFLTRRRLREPAQRFFEVEVRSAFPLQPEKHALLLRFRLDRTSSALRYYSDAALAERARDFFAEGLKGTDAETFLTRSRIDAVIIEPGRKVRIQAIDPNTALVSNGP